MPQINAFYPVGATVSISATTSSDSVALTAYDKSVGTVVVYNAGDALAFIEFGDSNVAAAVTNYPVAPGSTQTFGVGETHTGTSDLPTHIAAITASGTATVYITSGRGA